MTRLFFLSMLLATTAWAADPEFHLVIKDHKFDPAEITVPAGQKVKLIIENQDSTAEEFESKSLGREKVIAGKGSGSVFIGPLQPGHYPFVGEYNEKTAKGVVIAK